MIKCLELQHECNNVNLPGSIYALGVDNVHPFFKYFFFEKVVFYVGKCIVS